MTNLDTPMNTVDFGQVITAMITPFDTEGKVNLAQVEKLTNYLINNGSDSLVVCGTTGESPTLTWEEEYDLFQVVKATANGKAKVIAGTGSNSTAEAIAATVRAAKLQVDGSLQVTPYYNRPPQIGLIQHFQAIAKSVPDLPIILYNIPSRTGCRLEATTIATLALATETPNIVAIKEATGDLDLVSTIRLNTPPEFKIYCGDDSLTLPMLAVGGSGVISVASHLVGNQIKQMIERFMAGDYQLAHKIHLALFPLFKALFYDTNPIPLKIALKMLDRDSGILRSPLSIDPEKYAQLQQSLQSALKLANQITL
ncbi:MAG: 4-hydroxy-tetrahydrodipicolinate synthase [Pseudanabaenaceae cyanobacterium bins.68]|nr:4-hydroxy-tetrahydrodipicolinate synthase [Pseudanabaenaceae cyanobacterium bins.68]